MDRELIEKIRRRETQITVIGLGHVGLVTAVMFAKSGFKVLGVDVKPEVIEAVSSGRSHIREHWLSELTKEVVRNGNLKVTMDPQLAFKNSEVCIVCVQTPLTRDKQPDLSYLKKACEDVAKNLSRGKLVVIESSVPPGTTRKLVAAILEGGSKLKCGRDFWLVHCPERLAVGNTVRDFTENVRVIGGYDAKSTKIAAELFKTITKGEILTTECTTAEVAKLAENSFRDVNIAFANELALICEEIGVDVVDVVKLTNTHPRVNIHKPGSGVGGPCIPKDPYLLLHVVKNKGQRLKLMLSSRELNEYMPEHTVALIVKALKKVGKDVKTSKIAILGVAFKGETNDARNSPSEGIVQKLMKLGANTVVYDPYTTESFGATRASDVREALEGADCVVIVTEHEMFKKLELEELKNLMKQNPVIVDGRRIIDPMKAKKLGFTYAGVGHHI
jgi:UDP-N-acetyl-D-mannosaminuronic acid dehydrogenase